MAGSDLLHGVNVSSINRGQSMLTCDSLEQVVDSDGCFCRFGGIAIHAVVIQLSTFWRADNCLIPGQCNYLLVNPTNE